MLIPPRERTFGERVGEAVYVLACTLFFGLLGWVCLRIFLFFL